MVKVGVDPNWPPFSLVIEATGQLEGIDARVLDLIAKRSGLKFALVPTGSWSESWSKALAGEIDVTTATAMTEERRERFEFTSPYLEFPLVIIGRRDGPFYRSLSSLKGLRVAAPVGHVTADLLRQRAPQVLLLSAASQPEALWMVARGEADATVCNIAVATHDLEQLSVPNLKICGVLPDSFALRIAVRNDWPELVGILDKVLAGITSAERDVLLAGDLDFGSRLLAEAAEEKARLRARFWLVAGGVGLLAGVLAIWGQVNARRAHDRREAEARLREANAELESRVAARTATLAAEVEEHRRTEAALLLHERRYRAVVENGRNALLVLSVDGFIEFANQVAAAALRREPASLIGQCWLDFIAPDSRAEAVRLLSGEGSRVTLRWEVDGGVEAWHECAAAPLPGDDGREQRVVVAEDVTVEVARRAAAEAERLRISRQQEALLEMAKRENQSLAEVLRVITEVSARVLGVGRVGFWRFDPALSQIEAMDLYSAETGRHERGTVLRALDYPRYFLVIRESRAIAVHDARTHSCTSEFSESYLKPNGITSLLDVPVRRRGELAGVLCYEHRGPMRTWTQDEQSFATNAADFVSLAFEAEDRRLAEVALREANENLEARVAVRTWELGAAYEKLKDLDRLKSQFIATMSHELRTPLNSIIGFTGILLMGLPGQLNVEQQKQLNMVSAAARHLLSLINDILDLSRIESGRMEFHRTRFDLGELIQEACRTLQPQAEAKGVALRFDPPEEVLPVVSDRKRMLQILLNLIGNAVKFTDRGAVNVAARLTASSAEVTIMDTGIGIREESLPFLFEAFRQVDGSSRRNHEGSGLGLHLCRRFLALLGGEVSVQSRFGEGSTFTVSLPCGREEMLSPVNPRVHESAPTPG